jgi:hypothetical protein
MEAHSNPKMEAHSAPEKETHSVPEMETQSWQGILENFDNLSKCIEPQERKILAPDLFAVTWHQISEISTHPKNYEMVWDGHCKLTKYQGDALKWYRFSISRKLHHHLGQKKTKLDPCSSGNPLWNTANLTLIQPTHRGTKMEAHNGTKIKTHSALKKETHSVPKMATPS